MTASYHLIGKSLIQMKKLVENGYEVIPIVSKTIINDITEYSDGEKIKYEIKKITGHGAITNIDEAWELLITNPLDALVVLPATGNSIAKCYNGIEDTIVSFVIKETLANNKPVIIGISTNDGLGINSKNIGGLQIVKNVYMVGYGQDNYINKPNSLVADFDLLLPTLQSAINNSQLQPIIKEYHKTKKEN
jgi:dipicolinate synthase subunit B